jgi:hypothetical protein
MEIINFVLSLYGAIGATATLAQVAFQLIANYKECSLEDLFKKCFIRAVRRDGKVIKLVDDANDIEIEQHLLDEAVDNLKKRTGKSEDILEGVVPLFGALIKNKKSGNVISLNNKDICDIIKNAAGELFKELPFNEPAFQEYVVKNLRDQKKYDIAIMQQLKELAENQNRIISHLTYLNPIVLLKESVRSEYKNPFRITKAEEFDHNYPLLASLFKQPANYDLIKGRDNLILSGGRGCGKSMILRSLTSRTSIQIEATQKEKTIANYSESGLDYYGVYIKLAKGYFDDVRPDAAIRTEVAIQMFQHAFNMQLLKATLNSLIDSRKYQILQITEACEREISEKISELMSYFDVTRAQNFKSLQNLVRKEETAIGNYLGALRTVTGDNYNGHFTYVNDFPNEFCNIILSEFLELKQSRIYFLLDEFENLSEFQQTVVNTITKLRPNSLTLKIATRSLGVKSRIDLQGEPIQSPRDYQVVLLDYDVKSSEYKKLLQEISAKRLKAEGYKQTDITQIMQMAPKFYELIGADVKDLAKEHLNVKGLKNDDITESLISECIHQMGIAFIYRKRQGYKYPKLFSGFSDFVLCSSGIISNFLELCKMAFYLADSSGKDVRNSGLIPPDIQNEAIYLVSEVNIDWIAKNIPCNGPILSNLLLDLADIVREKLITHMSEPEASRIVIKDPDKLNIDSNKALAYVLDDALRWSVFQNMEISTAYYPKHKSDVRQSDFILNRLYAPKLKISPRARWRTQFTVEDLGKLIHPDTRVDRRNQLLKKNIAEPNSLFGKSNEDKDNTEDEQ